MVDTFPLHEVLESLQEGLQILGPDWRYLYVNDTVARQGRKSPEALLGKTMLECYPGIERTEVFGVLSRCMRERAAMTFETEFVYDGGDRAWFELRIRPWRDALVVLSVDITERRRLEHQARESRERALRELSTPVIRLQRGVLLVPLVGAVDSERAALIVTTILSRVAEEQARVLILDVAGLPVVDTGVANHLLETTAAVRLLGASTVLTGISPGVSKTIVQLGLDLSAMHTTSRLEEGIELARALLQKPVGAQ